MRPPKTQKRKGDPDRDPKESGDDPKRHDAIIARRWLGSPPPTPERYAHALRQWLALPGAVVSSATDISVATAPSPERLPPQTDGGEAGAK